MDPCKPENPRRCCDTCARRMPGVPNDPEARTQIVLLDVTTAIRAWSGAQCPLHVPSHYVDGRAARVERTWLPSRVEALA